MKSFKYVIKDAVGVHARPAGMLAKRAQNYKSTITFVKGNREEDVTKLMAIMSLGIKCGEEITVKVEGEDEDVAAEAIEAFIKENL